MPTPWRAWRRPIPTISMWRRSMRKRCSCCCRGRRLCGRRANGGAPARGAGGGAEARSASPGRVPSLHPHDRADAGAGRAAACAEHLGDAIPGASHINHMPAHVWTRIGRWGDAVQASLQRVAIGSEGGEGEGFMTYPAHDLQMLAFAASMDGQRALAMQAARGFATLTGDSMLLRWRWCGSASSTRWPRSANGRRTTFPPASGISRRDTRRCGAAIGAPRAAALDRLQQTARSSKAAFRIHPREDAARNVAAILEGEIQRAAANAAAAIAAFERAVSLQDTPAGRRSGAAAAGRASLARRGAAGRRRASRMPSASIVRIWCATRTTGGR